MNAPITIDRKRAELISGLLAEDIRRKRIAQCDRLLPFIEMFWHVLEPVTPFVKGWALEAVCEHLEAVTAGEINRLLINVSPGTMKSLTANVFWKAWEWGPVELPHLRSLNFSYAAHLTERDTGKFRDLITSPLYQELFGSRFRITKAGEQKVANDKTGWSLPSSIGGVSTGERGDRVVLDDPHNVKQGESDTVRTATVDWFGRSMSNRLNDMEKSAIVVIMQRIHENDVSGHILSHDLGYTKLIIPAEWDERRRYVTSIGWTDPRSRDGELFFPERFPAKVIARQKLELGPYSYSGQYLQSPEPAGGGIIKREWWQVWDEKRAKEEGVPLPGGKLAYPNFSYIIASLDTAYTEKTENDPSACTVWGAWSDRYGVQRAMLVAAWDERLEFNPLVERVAKTCKDFRVSRILIEAKAAGHSVAQELRRRYLTVGHMLALNPKTVLHGAFGVQLMDPSGEGDKVARTYSVQHLFSAGLVYAPNKAWAETVISQCAMFPKGEHDDLVDTTTQALSYLRRNGILTLPDERRAEDEEAMQYRSQLQPLYPV